MFCAWDGEVIPTTSLSGYMDPLNCWIHGRKFPRFFVLYETTGGDDFVGFTEVKYLIYNEGFPPPVVT